ncbi:hypothetical protein [Deinococcus apachensis]|uniref:hypothetical protein n=1 Tax=Deinococcus apachensis TaxID=309886 RepID=UPI00035DD4CB|nr:hypothetical protein [Deinococcus apachensis]
MRRPGQEGGAWAPLDSLPPTVKLAALRAFLTLEAAKGNTTALHLLREMRGHVGAVRS